MKDKKFIYQINEFLQRPKVIKWLPIIFFFSWFFLFLILSIFRDSRLDENIYFGETTVITDLLRRGIWIGNYGVGLHGFISKFVVGVIFLLSGPSIFLATLFNISLGVLSGIVFYFILKKHFKFSLLYSLLGVTLLFCNFQLLTYIPTYYRDIGALLFVLLILESILGERSKWLTGVYLLLLLDSKEHVFYTLLPAILIWIIIKAYLENKGKIIQILKEVLLNCLKMFLPSLLFLLLMFSTSVIPLNIYDAKILGLIKGGFVRMLSDFDTNLATYNRDIVENENIAKAVPLIKVENQMESLQAYFINGFNTFLSYLGKIFYPRTFSFLTIPFVLLIPSILTMFNCLKIWFKKMDSKNLSLPIILIVYILIYIFHASIGRYLIPILPVVIIFFLIFLKNFKKEKKYLAIMLVTLAFSIVGLFFEYSYLLIKIGFVAGIFITFLFMYFIKDLNRLRYKYLLIIILSAFTAGTSLLVSYKNGPIGSYLKFGYCRESEKIISLVKEDDRIWINDLGWDRLPFILRSENMQNPEWRWRLKPWVPKKSLLKNERDLNTYNFNWSSGANFKEKISEESINKIVFIKLSQDVNSEGLLLQDRLNVLLESDWIKLEESIVMKNKVVYIFNVEDNK